MQLLRLDQVYSLLRPAVVNKAPACDTQTIAYAELREKHARARRKSSEFWW
jgi:hypothetical protein